MTWEEYSRKIGLQLQKERERRKWSQERVAYDAHMSKVQYQRIEGGGYRNDPVSNPTIKSLIAIAEVLDLKITDLLAQPWPDLRSR